MKVKILEEAKHLPVAERIELAEAIWDSIAEDAGTDAFPVPDSHRDKLDRRLADIKAGSVEGRSWEDVRGRLERLR